MGHKSNNSGFCASDCYGREDLLRVAEAIASEMGNIDISEELCEQMAKAAANFVEHLENGGTFSYVKY